MEKEDRLNRMYRRGKNVALGLAFLAGTALCTHRTINSYSPFSEQDFKNAKWYSSSVNADEAYNFEKIPHNQMVRDFYFEQVRKKNGSLEKAHLYPDLDKNGKVAQ